MSRVLARRLDNAPIGQALAWFATVAGPSIGYAYTPSTIGWFRTHTGSPEAVGPDGPFDLSGVFELRASDGERELRWLHATDQRGTAVVLAPEGVATLDGHDVSPAGVVERPSTCSRYLAGTVRRSGEGWSELFSGRFGRLSVPLAAPARHRVALVTIEHLVEDKHGNCDIVDARWVGLSTGGTP